MIGRLRTVVVAILTAMTAFWLTRWALRVDFHPRLFGTMPGTKQSVVYALDRDRWIRFDVAEPRRLVRIISNAVVAEESAPVRTDFSEPAYQYTIEYRVEEPDGTLIESGRHHYRSRVHRVFDPKSRTETAAGRLLDEPGAVVLAAQHRLLDLGARDRRVVVALRAPERSPGVSAVIVRVHTLERLQRDELWRRWLRLSDEQQAELAENTVYPPELLRQDEQLQLVENRWRPLGPRGLEGEDYRSQRLESLIDAETAYMVEPVLPQGLYVDRERIGIIPIPPGMGPIELHFEKIEWPNLESEPAQPIRLSWRGTTAIERRIWQITDPRRPLMVSEDLAPGVLEIEAGERLIVRAKRQEDVDLDLTPEARLLRLYQLGPGSPIEFQIDHLDGSATPFRIDLRAASPTEVLPAPAPVRYTLRDADGASIGSGELRFDVVPSRYDRPVEAMVTGRVSQPVTHYFRFSKRVALLRLESEAELWVAAYTRPPDLPYHVADTTSLPWIPWSQRTPMWFLTRPVESSMPLDARPTLVIDDQPEPDRAHEREQALASGDYEWEALRPFGSWEARPVLTPIDSSQPVRDEARSSVYRPLKPWVEQSIGLFAERAVTRVTPDLRFLRTSSNPFSVRIWVDGQRLIDRRMAGRHGKLSLPNLTAGFHRFRIEDEGAATWLLDHADASVTDSALLERQVLRLRRGQPLHLFFDKKLAGEEMLLGRVFLTAPGQTVRLRVRIGGMPAQEDVAQADWTQPERSYDIQAPVERWAYLLLDDWRLVPDGARIHAILGADRTPGRYPIEVWLERGDEAYVQFFRLLPGRMEQRESVSFRSDGPT